MTRREFLAFGFLPLFDMHFVRKILLPILKKIWRELW